jgi:hypothetical protein
MEINVNVGAPFPTRYLYLDWGDYILYYTFFFALNTVGAIIGYWMSRTTFLKQWLEARADQKRPQIIKSELTAISVLGSGKQVRI